MAEGLNSVYLLGFLGADPTLRQAGGSSVLSMSLACSETYLDKNRVRQERTEWVAVSIWGRRAEALAKFMRKGDRVFIEGRLQTRSWEDREGVKRYKTEVVAENVILGGSNNPRKKPDDPERERPNRRDHYDEKSTGGGGGADDYGSAEDFEGDDSILFACVARANSEAWWTWNRRDPWQGR
jgi:single-strand DNA-binding protein